MIGNLSLLSEFILSTKQPTFAKTAVRRCIVAQQCKIASPILPWLRVRTVRARVRAENAGIVGAGAAVPLKFVRVST